MNEPEDPGGTGEHLAALPANDGSGGVLIADEQAISVGMDAIRRIAVIAAAHAGIAGEISIALVEPDRIADLKGRYYGEQAPTDVLAFPMDGPRGPVAGDVVVCPAFAAKQARALGRDLDDEIAQLVVHGIIHLTGADHATPRDELAMAARERTILGARR